MIQVLNRETISSKKIKPPTIQIFKDGQIRFNCQTVKMLNFTETDKIEFCINSLDPNIIFFRKSEKGIGLSKEITIGGQMRLLLCSRPLVRRLMTFFSLAKSETFSVTNETTKINGDNHWFIMKDKMHKPIEWKKKDPYKFNTSRA